ncbi:MAG: hypothetical protein WDA59_00415 [Methanofastidiosum sp.]
MAVKNHVSLIAVATSATSANSAVINAKSICWITNHDDTSAITFNFEEGTATSGAFMVGTAATVKNINIPVTTIYYDCTGASAAFSLFGIAR